MGDNGGMRTPILLLVSAMALVAQTTPSPALLVLNKQDSTLAIVDPATRQVVWKVATGSNPHEVAASDDGRWAFVTNYGRGANSLSVIDLTARTEKRVDISPLRSPHGIWFSGGKVYFTAEDSKAIGRYDPATGKVDATQDSQQERTHMVLLTRDAKTMFSSNMGSSSVNIYQPAAGGAWSVTSIPVGPTPEAIDLSPNEKEIWTAHGGDGGVTVIDVAKKAVIATLPRLSQRPNRLKFTPDGKRVLISDAGNGELIVVDAATRKELKRVKVGSIAEGIQMEPGGARAYVALERDNEVAIVDLTTLTVTGRISTGTGPDGLAWAVRR
jgi:YVTN family beta-propeller protein